MNRSVLNRTKGVYTLTDDDLNSGIKLFLRTGHYTVYDIEMKHVKIVWKRRAFFLGEQGVSTVFAYNGKTRLMIIA